MDAEILNVRNIANLFNFYVLIWDTKLSSIKRIPDFKTPCEKDCCIMYWKCAMQSAMSFVM